MVEVAVAVAGPIVGERPVKLDALLEWSVARERDLPWLSRGHELPEPLPIPIDSIHACGAVLNLCSDWIAEGPGTPYRHTWVRRRDPVDVESLAGSFNRSYGPGRDLLLRAYGVHVTTVRWLVSTPDPDRLLALLQRITHLGKLRAHGCGELGGAWVVVPAAADTPPARALVTEDGLAARPLPISVLESWDGGPQRLAVLPPYWHPARHVPAVPTGARVALRPEFLASVPEV